MGLRQTKMETHENVPDKHYQFYFPGRNSKDTNYGASELGGYTFAIPSTTHKDKVHAVFVPCSTALKDIESCESEEQNRAPPQDITGTCVIYFHGNGEDLGDNRHLFGRMRISLRANICGVEYPGYGIANKVPNSGSEKIKSDALDIYRFVNKELGFLHENILVFGRSIGSGPACYLSSVQSQVKNLVLMSPFLSTERFAKDIKREALAVNLFDNAAVMGTVAARLMIIHGEMDTLIPIKQAEQLAQAYNKSQKQHPPAQLIRREHMSHNNFTLEEDIFKPIKDFMSTAQGNSKSVPFEVVLKKLEQYRLW